METVAKNTSEVISDEEVTQFHEDGYLVVKDLIPQADLQAVIDELTDEVGRRAEKLVESGDLEHSFEDDTFETRLAKISQETDKLALSIWNGMLHGPAIFHLITHPRLLDFAERMCGEEVIASSVYRLRPKIPNYGYGAVPWHQDSSYFEPYCDKALVITVWLPLVDTNEENGCLWVIPKSHLGEVVPHQLDPSGKYLEISDENLPAGDRVCCAVPKGGVLVMTNRTVHGSFQNNTDGVRWSMDLRYQSASLPTNAPITRLEGDALPSVELGVPAACYPPEADFLVRSKKRPAEIIKTAEEFLRLREGHLPVPVTNRWGVSWKAPVVTVE